MPRPEVDGTFEAAVEVMTKIRGAKTMAQKSLRWPVATLEIAGAVSARDSLAPVMDDILRAGNVVGRWPGRSAMATPPMGSASPLPSP